MQDLNDKITGGSLSAGEWNEVPSELQNVIEALGQTLSAGDLNQLGKSICGYAQAGPFMLDSGAADAYVVNPIGGKQGPPALDADFDGGSVRFRPTNNNTGASTVNVNALGSKDIVREDGSALSSGDIVTTQDAYIRWDQAADDFRLLNFAIAGTVEVPRGYIDGIITSNAADTDHDITFGVGLLRDQTDANTISFGTLITKQSDVGGVGEGGGGWVVGTNAAGFPSALTRTADTWYHLFVLKNPTSGVVDCGFDSNLIATNLLADATGFTLWRRVGAVLMDSSINIIQYTQTRDYFAWNDSKQDVTALNPGTGEVVHSLDFVPPSTAGQEPLADVVVHWGRPNTGTATFFKVGPGGQTISVPSATNQDARTGNNGRRITLAKMVRTNSVATIKTRQSLSDASAELFIQVHGWVDDRQSNEPT